MTFLEVTERAQTFSQQLGLHNSERPRDSFCLQLALLPEIVSAENQGLVTIGTLNSVLDTDCVYEFALWFNFQYLFLRLVSEVVCPVLFKGRGGRFFDPGSIAQQCLPGRQAAFCQVILISIFKQWVRHPLSLVQKACIIAEKFNLMVFVLLELL